MFRELTEAENEKLMMKIAGIKINPAAEKNSALKEDLLEDMRNASREALMENELIEMSYKLIGIKTDGR